MKQLAFLLLGLSLFIFSGCVNDSADNPAFGEKDIPSIYVGWQTSMAFKIGTTINIEPKVSPSDGATYRWTLDGYEIATTKDLSYTPSELLVNSELKFEVTRNGVSNSRKATVFVTKDFVPKPNKLKLVGFLTKNGVMEDIDWGSITHLVISSATVKADGTLDFAMPQLNMTALLAVAHHYGVYVLLEISGVINYINSGCLYDSWTFYTPAVANPEGMAANIEKMMKDYGFDGVNIYMDKASTMGSYEKPAAVKTFYETVAEKIKGSKHTIDGNEYDYLLTMSVLGGWTKESLGVGTGGSGANVVNMPQYDWINVLAFLDEDIVNVPRSHGTVAYARTEISSWLNWASLGPIEDPSRLVLIAPASGIRYYGIPATYTWPTWDNFTQYISYRDICLKYPDAPTRNPAVIIVIDNYNNRNREVDKTYYNGLKDMEDRVNQIVIPNKLGGTGLWSLESDAQDPAISLLMRLKTTLDRYE
jgi:hypothetical protein